MKTPVGTTECEDTASGLAQGYLDGAVITAVSINDGVNEEFIDANETEGRIPIKNANHILARFFHPLDVFHPCIFQDDMEKCLQTEILHRMQMKE